MPGGRHRCQITPEMEERIAKALQTVPVKTIYNAKRFKDEFGVNVPESDLRRIARERGITRVRSVPWGSSDMDRFEKPLERARRT